MNTWGGFVRGCQTAAGVKPVAKPDHVAHKKVERSKKRLAKLRSTIVSTIIQHPGLHSNQICELVKPKIHIATMRVMLNELCKEGLLTRRATVDTSNKHYVYFLKRGC